MAKHTLMKKGDIVAEVHPDMVEEYLLGGYEFLDGADEKQSGDDTETVTPEKKITKRLFKKK